MANGKQKKAGEICVGDFVYAPHQDTLEYGNFEILAADIITQPKLLLKFEDSSTIKVSDTHKFLMVDDSWKQMLHIKLGDTVQGQVVNKRIIGMEYIGEGRVVKFNVDQAHTYVSEGLVSHNDKKEGGLVGYAMGGDIGANYDGSSRFNQGPQYPMQQPQNYAPGGITNSRQAAVQSYIASAQKTPQGMKDLLAKAQSGDYDAMIAMNTIQDTPNQNYAAGGGIYNLGGYSDGGRLLKGPGDGVSDDIPAQIGAKQPARLADGEFVIPARIVSELGNGSTDAGAKRLYSMMDRVQKGRKKSVGKDKVAVDSKAYKHLPA
jgi:hypothetical protein